MKTKDAVIGLVVLVILITSALLIKRARTNKLQNMPSATPTVEQRIKDTFGGLIIPEDVDKADLTDVSGGDGVGIATRTEILADLPEPTSNRFYQAWLEKDGKKVLLGRMRVAKGGYIIEYDGARYPGYNKVVVTLGETRILEGSF